LSDLNNCSLCSQEVFHHGIQDGINRFCCAGCRAVYGILSAKNLLENYDQTVIFQQAVTSGLISNPSLIDQIRQNRVEVAESERERLYLEVGEMWCPSCAEVIKLLLLQKKGILNCVVDYATDLASIEFAPRFLSKESILATIRQMGYTPVPLESSGKRTVSFLLYLRLIVAAFFSMNVMMFSYPIYASYFSSDPTGISMLFVWFSFLASLPVVVFSGWPILRRFWTAMSVGVVGMEALIVIGVASAFGLSLYEMLQGGKHVYFDSMTVIITFVLLGKVIETKAKFSAKDSLVRLARAIPKRGRKKFTDGREEYVPLKEVCKGDYLVVHTGEKIVLDGVVDSGSGACDESVMTGESIPVRKAKGDLVLCGTVVVQGSMVYQAVANEEETALQKIISVVEQDIGHKSVYTRAVDSIVAWFVPAVLVFAFGTVCGCWMAGCSIETGVLRAVSVLLISCPCAIGIAAPLAESQILNVLAGMGAIVRNRGCLPDLGRETVFVFDKTGTITEGRFEVLSGLEHLNVSDRSILKGLACKSSHPVSVGIAQSIYDVPVVFDEVMEIAGLGMEGRIGGVVYRLGSPDWTGTKSSEKAHTQVHFTKDGVCLTKLLLGDCVREEAAAVVKAMAPAQTMLVSGDSKHVVEKTAKVCGFNDWRWRCHPLDKRDVIDALRNEGEIVGMIGDGINDAPALTGAHVGVSVVTATDISIQVSDILLTTDRLNILPNIRRIARKGQRIIRQNLFWAFFYNVIGIGLAAFGFLNPIFSAGAMVLSSLMVIGNARRIR
jgi:heavy metal translocating P-type ATPase